MSLDMRDQSGAMGLGAKWAGFLRQAFPAGARIKAVAEYFGRSAATAKRWLTGSPPDAASYHRAERGFGPAFIAWMHTGFDWAEHAALMAEVEAMESRLAELRSRLDRPAPDGAGDRVDRGGQAPAASGRASRPRSVGKAEP